MVVDVSESGKEEKMGEDRKQARENIKADFDKDTAVELLCSRIDELREENKRLKRCNYLVGQQYFHDTGGRSAYSTFGDQGEAGQDAKEITAQRPEKRFWRERPQIVWLNPETGEVESTLAGEREWIEKEARKLHRERDH